jgi:cold shock protein
MAGTTGVVKYYLADKGYGFVKRADGGRDVFIHASALKVAGIELLNEGDKIAFDVDPNPGGKGPRANNVRRLDA